MAIDPDFYYKHVLVDSPPDIKHRQFRIITTDGKWVILFRACNKKILQKKLQNFLPIHAYVSNSTWLNPQVVGLKWKKRYKNELIITKNIILSSDFTIDFDTQDMANLIKAYNHLKDNGLEKFKFVKTKRGMHLWVLDWYSKCCIKKILHPFAREAYIRREKIKLANELKSIGINFDYDVVIDTRRVYRLWDSLYGNELICKASDNITPKLPDNQGRGGL